MEGIAEPLFVTTAKAALWASFGLIGYTYVLYPWLIRRAAARIRVPHAREPREAELPSVTVVIAAHNAGAHLRTRLENLLECDYPPSKLAILVASDGSSDSTVAQVRALANPRITVIDDRRRRGKSATLCDAVRRVRSEVVLFTDVTTHFERSAIRRLSRHFSDPAVGIAIGQVTLLDERGERAEGLYWRMESRLRRDETNLGTVLGASGAIYALRRRVFSAPARPIINDDLVIPMLAQLVHRCRAVFDETARAYTFSPHGLAVDFRRRCRIGAGGYQSLAVLGTLWRPCQWRHAWAFVSHKILRWMVPFLLIIALAGNLMLIAEPVYGVLLALQLGGYGLAVLGCTASGGGPVARISRLAASFCVMNLAILVGFCRWLIGADSVVWVPTARQPLARAGVVPRPALDQRTRPIGSPQPTQVA